MAQVLFKNFFDKVMRKAKNWKRSRKKCLKLYNNNKIEIFGYHNVILKISFKYIDKIIYRWLTPSGKFWKFRNHSNVFVFTIKNDDNIVAVYPWPKNQIIYLLIFFRKSNVSKSLVMSHFEVYKKIYTSEKWNQAVTKKRNKQMSI